MKKNAREIRPYFLCVFCAVGLFVAKADGQSVCDLLQQGVSLQGAVVPLYPAGAAQPVAVVRVDRAYLDYQRRGFFRIGLLPVGVLEGVTVEVRDTSSPSASLACLRRWLGTKDGQKIEMRRVKFILSATNHLDAGLAKCAAGDHWELLKGVECTVGATEVRAPRATLQTTGPRAGQVIFETVPPSTNSFLCSDLAVREAVAPAVSASHSTQ